MTTGDRIVSDALRKAACGAFIAASLLATGVPPQAGSPPAPVLIVTGTPGLAIQAATPAAAAAAAGFGVQIPALIPSPLELTGVELFTGRAVTITTSLTMGEDGEAENESPVQANDPLQTWTATVTAAVQLNYQSGRQSVRMLQTPEADALIPANLSVRKVAEYELEKLGVEREKARRLARAIDWRSALLIPLPSKLLVIKQIELPGSIDAVYVQGTGLGSALVEGLIFWSSYGQLYALVGTVPEDQLITMAQTVQ